jgi:uncharacterized membrane protein YphA (DoxX/SURF4 family)
MVTLFADIGAGQWLRHVVGALELAGAIGLLVPAVAGAAATGLTALMTGALLTRVAVLGGPPVAKIGRSRSIQGDDQRYAYAGLAKEVELP